MKFISFGKPVREALFALHEPESARFITEVYWRALVVVALLMILASSWYGWSEATGVAAELDAAGAGESFQKISLDRTKLDKAIAGFAARSQRYGEVKAEHASDPDPSK